MALGNPIDIYVPDVDERIADGWTSVRIYKSTSQTGTYTLLDTVTLAAGDHQYSYTDTTGILTDWYYLVLYNSSTTTEGTAEDPFPAGSAPIVTRRTLARMAADLIRCFVRSPGEHTPTAASGTTTGTGSTTTVVCDTYADSLLADDGVTTTGHYRGYWLVLRGGSASGQARRITTLATDTGTFTVSRAFTAAPGSSVDFDIFAPQLTPQEWSDMVDLGFHDLYLPFTWQFSMESGQTEVVLPYWIEREDQLADLSFRYGDTTGEFSYIRGVIFEVIPKDGGGVSLYIPGGLSGGSVYQLTGFRRPVMPTSDTEMISLAEQHQRLIAYTAAMRAAQRIADEPGTLREDRDRWKERMTSLEDNRKVLVKQLGSAQQGRSPRRSMMVPVGDGVGPGRLPWPGSRYY